MPNLVEVGALWCGLDNIPYMPKLKKCDTINFYSTNPEDYQNGHGDITIDYKDFKKYEKQIRNCKSFAELLYLEKFMHPEDYEDDDEYER